MATVITFPAGARYAPAPPPGLRRIGFVADIYLTGGRLGFSLLYPNGPVGRATVAAMLRRAADELDPKP